MVVQTTCNKCASGVRHPMAMASFKPVHHAASLSWGDSRCKHLTTCARPRKTPPEDAATVPPLEGTTKARRSTTPRRAPRRAASAGEPSDPAVRTAAPVQVNEDAPAPKRAATPRQARSKSATAAPKVTPSKAVKSASPRERASTAVAANAKELSSKVVPLAKDASPAASEETPAELAATSSRDSTPSAGTIDAVALTEPNGQATSFGILFGISVSLVAAALLVPEQMLALIVPGKPLVPLDTTLLRIAGCTLIISATVEYCLQDAAANKRLPSATYQRLMVATMAKNLGFLAAFLQAADVWTPALVLLYPSVPALALFMIGGIFLHSNTKDGVPGMPNLAFGLVPQNKVSWGYSAMVLLYLATAAACYAPPDAPSLFLGPEGPVSQLLKHTWAPGFFLASVAALNLKDAADRGRLGASTFKCLNLGLAGLEVTYAGVFLYSMITQVAVVDVASVSNWAASLVIAGFCLKQYNTAKKK